MKPSWIGELAWLKKRVVDECDCVLCNDRRKRIAWLEDRLSELRLSDEGLVWR